MPPEPVPANPGWDEDLAWLDRDPERETWLDRAREHDDSPREVEYADFSPLTEDELAEIREAAADELLAVEAATTGRRGPGQPGSARVFPGESSSPAAAFGPGLPLDVLPGCAQSGGLRGRRRETRTGSTASPRANWSACCAPGTGSKPTRPPASWPWSRSWTAATRARRTRSSPRTRSRTRWRESRVRADELTGTAGRLDTHLPGTRAALYDGTLSLGKARIIVTATAQLDETEARAAENKVLDRAGRLTPGGLRTAIARAAMEVAPKKAKKRRETGAKFARVERWAEDSGNAALMGRELPPDEVLAADQRIAAWATELRKAGLEGGMDELRARAYLDLLLGKDSRPRHGNADGGGDGGSGGPRARRLGRPTALGGTGRVRRAGQPDSPAGHPD